MSILYASFVAAKIPVNDEAQTSYEDSRSNLDITLLRKTSLGQERTHTEQIELVAPGGHLLVVHINV